jgi:nucleoid-associated protein YgaU
VSSQAEANAIRDAIKAVPDWQKDVVADIEAKTGASGSPTTYTVKAGDSLSKIAKHLLGEPVPTWRSSTRIGIS